MVSLGHPVTLQGYLENKNERALSAMPHRAWCLTCRKPQATCYCALVRPFESFPTFAILIHRRETRRTVATGRMAHLCLSNSLLLEGTDFTEHPQANALICDDSNHCMVLAPGPRSVNLTHLPLAERTALFPPGKRPIVFVIDGTWAQARRMLKLSRNLQLLPSICFTPQTPSRFRVRRQPAPHCYSTIEAIHACIALLGGETPPPQGMLDVFHDMADRQFERAKEGKVRRTLI